MMCQNVGCDMFIAEYTSRHYKHRISMGMVAAVSLSIKNNDHCLTFTTQVCFFQNHLASIFAEAGRSLSYIQTVVTLKQCFSRNTKHSSCLVI